MIKPVFRVVTSQYPILATTTIEGGMVVTIDSNGRAVACGASDVPVGISADRNRASEAYEFVNRVSDSGNDTRASGLLSVYHGGGEFYVDMDDSAITTPAGTAITGVIVNGATVTPDMQPLYAAASGQMDDSGSTIVARTIENPVNYDGTASLETGIPGEFEPGSSVDYADDDVPRTWVKIKLII